MDDTRVFRPGSDEPLTDDELTTAYAMESGLRVNFVSSVDGAVTLDGLSGGLGTAGDHRIFNLLRRLCDAVLVGSGTLLKEGYGPIRLGDEDVAWREKRGLAPHPTLVVATRSLSVDPSHRMLTEAPVRPIVLTQDEGTAGRRDAYPPVADVLVSGTDTIDFRRAKRALADRGLSRVLCEGGPTVLGALTADDAIDELCLTISPVLAGPGAGRITAGPHSEPRPMRLGHVFSGADALFCLYKREI